MGPNIRGFGECRIWGAGLDIGDTVVPGRRVVHARHDQLLSGQSRRKMTAHYSVPTVARGSVNSRAHTTR